MTDDRVWSYAEAAAWCFRNDVGKQHGTPLEADDNEIIVGALALILREVRKLRAEQNEDRLYKGDGLRGHRWFLEHHHKTLLKLIQQHAAHVLRIQKIVGESVRIRERAPDINEFARLYRKQSATFYGKVRRLRSDVKRMCAIKSLDDLEKIKGISKAAASKIRNRIAGPAES